MKTTLKTGAPVNVFELMCMGLAACCSLCAYSGACFSVIAKLLRCWWTVSFLSTQAGSSVSLVAGSITSFLQCSTSGIHKNNSPSGELGSSRSWVWIWSFVS